MEPDIPGAPGTYLWLAVAGIVLILSTIAFLYLLLRRRGGRAAQAATHPYLAWIDRQLATYLPGFWRFVRARFSIQTWHGLELTVTAAVVVVGLMAFVFITENWTDESELYEIDQQVSTWLSETIDPATERFMRATTRLGNGEIVFAMCIGVGILLLARHLMWHLLTLALAPGLGSAIVVALKAIFGRDRPGSEAAADLGHSFPSGHAFAAMAFYGLLVYFAWRHLKNDLVRICVTIVLVVLIFLVGISRVMLRVHWVSDVMGGFVLGLAWLVLSISVTLALQRSVSPSRKLARAAPPDME